MSRCRAMPVLAALLGLGACTDSGAGSAPVTVAVPGMPNPELALQRSIDRVHDFLASLNQRIDTPARQQVPLATSHPGPIMLAPQLATATAAAAVPSFSHEAQPLYGKGVTWFTFGDGYTRLHCTAGSVCIIRLQPGETVDTPIATTDAPSGWRVNVVRGTRGIHAGWAIAVSPTPDAAYGVLHVTSSRRSYAIGLDPSGPDMRTVAFAYADSDPASQAEPPAAAGGVALATAQGSSGTPDFDYQLSGAEPTWKPMRVYSDGTHTYVQFPPGGILAAPRLVVLAPGGDGPQSYRTVGDSYVVDRRVTSALLIGSGPGTPTIRITHGGRA